MKVPDWSGSSGDIWARRWRDTDRALAEVGAALDQAIQNAAPAGAFRALDVGCGPGTTALALATRRADAEIIGADVSRSLIDIAAERGKALPNIRFIPGDAEIVARDEGPFDLIFSRHGVMFFTDPKAAFTTLRAAATPDARLVFSCFREWHANPWAAELGAAAAGRDLPSPGREPSGFAFAEPSYVREILSAAGWQEPRAEPLDFNYQAGSSDDALSFLAELGPAARILEEMNEEQRSAAVERMRQVIQTHERGGQVIFQGAAWIWSATA